MTALGGGGLYKHCTWCGKVVMADCCPPLTWAPIVPRNPDAELYMSQEEAIAYVAGVVKGHLAEGLNYSEIGALYGAERGTIRNINLGRYRIGPMLGERFGILVKQPKAVESCERTCIMCGTGFTADNHKQKSCSSQCKEDRDAWRNSRKRGRCVAKTADEWYAYRNALPTGNPRRKITEEQAREIYVADGLHTDIADRYGVSVSVVSQIKRRTAWAFATQGMSRPQRNVVKRMRIRYEPTTVPSEGDC